MGFFNKLINLGKKSLEIDQNKSSRSKTKSEKIVFDKDGRAYAFNKLIIDGEIVGFKRSDGVFYGKESETSQPAYYLKSNGNKATLNELKGIDTGIWLSVSALNLSPFVDNSPKNKSLGFDSKNDLIKIINAYQDLTSIATSSKITLEEYTKLKRELSKYFDLKENQTVQENSSPRIIKNPLTKKFEIALIPDNVIKEDFEKQYKEKLKLEIERQKRESAEMAYVVTDKTSSEDYGFIKKSTHLKAKKVNEDQMIKH